MDEKGQKQVEATLRQHRKRVERNSRADSPIVPSVLGRAVMELLEGGRPVTRESLALWVQEKLEATPSARGKMEPDLDLQRAQYEAAAAWFARLPTY